MTNALSLMRDYSRMRAAQRPDGLDDRLGGKHFSVMHQELGATNVHSGNGTNFSDLLMPADWVLG
jgi:hypothetical protein